MIPKVSIIASAVRHQLFPDVMESLKDTTVPYEVVFSGHCKPEDVEPIIKKYPNLKYIYTGWIKPAQAYEIARREARGETILWAADDCEFPNDVVGKAYRYWKNNGNEKLILSIQTKESGYQLLEGKLFDMKQHRLIPHLNTSPIMAPLGLISRQFLQDIGGFDRKYICGQYENLVVMMALERGGSVEIFGGPDCFIDIDHLGKSIRIGESVDQDTFIKRPFASGYVNDREALLHTCFNFKNKFHYYPPEVFYAAERFLNDKMKPEDMGNKLLDDFEPYTDKDILTKSQGPKGDWE